MTLEENTYTYRQLPWLSKSTILGYRFCPYLFDLRYNKGVDLGMKIEASTGTNMHELYDKFFERINYEELLSFVISDRTPLEKTEIYNYFYAIVIAMIPPDSRDFEPYQVRVKNFCLLEAAHWIELYKKYNGNYNKIRNFFEPIFVEKFLECEPLMIFGTIDRKSYYEKDEKIQILYDYKTGHVPKTVKKGTRNNDPFSWSLPTKKNFELHFYLVLEMYRRGFNIDPDLIAYCTEEEYFCEDAEYPDVKSVFYDSKDKPVNPKDYYRLGIIYTGNDEPWVPKKYPHGRSLKSVFVWINKIRTVIKNGGPYNKEPDYWKCQYCNENVQEVCLSHAERKAIFWGEQDNSSEDV